MKFVCGKSMYCTFKGTFGPTGPKIGYDGARLRANLGMN